MDLIDEEKSLETEQNADEDEDYELLFGHKRQTPAEREPEKPSKMSRKAIRVMIWKKGWNVDSSEKGERGPCCNDGTS